MQIAAIRHKGDQSAIRDKAELDDYIRRIGLVDLAMEANVTDLNVALQVLKQKHLAEQNQLAADRNELLVRVQAYVQLHRDELLNGKAKTLRLNFGKAGWRKQKTVIDDFPKKSTPEMDELCKQILAVLRMQQPPIGYGEEEFEKIQAAFAEVSIVTEHAVQKTQLTSVPDEGLFLVGLSRNVPDDEFFVEPDREKLRETAQPEVA